MTHREYGAFDCLNAGLDNPPSPLLGVVAAARSRSYAAALAAEQVDRLTARGDVQLVHGVCDVPANRDLTDIELRRDLRRAGSREQQLQDIGLAVREGDRPT